MSGEQRLPSGTVTMLFTDIEGSTRLLKQLGEDYGKLLCCSARQATPSRKAVDRSTPNGCCGGSKP